MTEVCPPNLDFVLRPGSGDVRPGDTAREVLEVHLVFGDTLLQTDHLVDGEHVVTYAPPTSFGWSAALIQGFSPSTAHAAPVDEDVPRFLRVGTEWMVVDRGVRYPIPEAQPCVVTAGELTWIARRVPAAKPIARKTRVDAFFLGLLGLSAFAAVSLAAVAAFWPAPPEADLQDFAERMESVLQLQVVPPPKVQPQAAARAGSSAPKAAKAAPREEGRTRRGDSERVKGAERSRVDREVAMTAGTLGWLTENGAESGFGGADQGLRDALANGSWGRKGGDPTGTGLGRRGDGLGRSGEVGELAGASRGVCPPGSRCRGAEVGADWGKMEGGIKVDAAATVFGGLPRDAIDRVIKQNLSAIRYCYQRQLQRNPSLQGKVVSRFVIARDGTVSESSIKGSTVAEPAVGSCIQERIARLKFPEPVGGGVVIVSYPFLFAAGP